MNLIQNIKDYFKKKENKEDTGSAPVGVCPNCWGEQEWEEEFYKKIKANNITPEHSTYDNFIHQISQKLDEITLKEDTYICETCRMSYNSEH